MVWMGSAGLLMWLALGVAKDPSTCRVQVRGMPHSQLRHHELVVGQRVYRAGAEVEVSKSSAVGELRGPRYRGSVRLGEPCDGVVLAARPLPAVVSFACLPAGAVITCDDCPGWVLGRPYLPGDVPSVHVKSWALDVTLVLKARGYEPLVLEVTLHPGPNRVEPSMKTRPPSCERVRGPC